MDERYKMAVAQPAASQLQRRAGSLGRIGRMYTPKSEQCHLLVTLTNNGSGKPRPIINVRVAGEVCDAYGIEPGSYATLDYEVSPDSTLFVFRRATDQTGLKTYRTKTERGLRVSFTASPSDIENLFSDERCYECEMVHHDSASGAIVFEETK